jgi:hypothetical protein
MKKLIVVAMLALAIPAAALATDPNPGTPTQNAAAQAACRTQRAAVGTVAFRTWYAGTVTTTNTNHANAFGKCISAAVKQDQANTAAANNTCKAAELANKTAFKAQYASLGKCVSTTAAAATKAARAATLSAAKSCKAALVTAGTTAAFNTTYGSFGKCVSTKTHTP